MRDFKSRIFCMLRKLNFHIALLFLCFLLQMNIHAQRRDSLQRDYTHDMHFVSAFLPSCMIACGTAVTFSPEWSSVNLAVKDWTQEKVHLTTAVDNYLQWTPMASVYVLNVCGMRGVHHYVDLTAISALSYLLGWGVNTGIKYGVQIKRPDGTGRNSFPSGHTMTAFVGAEIMRREFGREHPWIAVGGYTAAAATGFLRMSNNRHWMSDVLAGAGIGMLSTSLVYWAYPYLRSFLTSSGRCKGYVFCDGQGMQLGATLQLSKAVQYQPAALPDFSFTDSQGRGNTEGGVAEQEPVAQDACFLE